MLYDNKFPERDSDTDVQGILDQASGCSNDPYEQFKWLNNNSLSQKQSIMGMVQWTQDYFHSVSKTKVELSYSQVDDLMRGLHFAMNYMHEGMPDHIYNYIHQKVSPVLDDITKQKYSREN